MKSVLYPGSFDPLTNGHLDVILRLKKIFDRVVVLVAQSESKKYLFSVEERVDLLREALVKHRGIEVTSGRDLTVKIAKKMNIQIIARSARTISDWEYEYALADANKKLAPDIETIFIMADPQHSATSSTLVREIAAYSGDTSKFVPSNVAKVLKKRGSK
jgi:pantetheine-phosphate adenylyltransferase